MDRPKGLDLFCCAGGSSKGFHDAGFDMTGVDNRPQPRYPFRFVLGDALEYVKEHGHEYAFIAASPPCQAYSAMSNCRPGLAGEYPALIGQTRALLQASGLSWVLENVEGAPLARSDDLFGGHGVMLCGQMFGLDLYRHRIFETSFPVTQPGHPAHDIPASAAGHWEPGTVMSVSGHCAPIAVAEKAMGIDWMTRDELAEAVPPAYTRWIGERLLAVLPVHDPQEKDTVSDG